MLRPTPQKENKRLDLNGLESLSPLEKKTRMVAIVVAFISVFFWAIKILFL